MLTQTSNPKYSYLRRVMLLPLLVITISLVSIKVHAREKIEKKVEAIKENLISFVADTTKPTIINIKADTVNQQNKPVYFVDGVKITEVEMNAISADKIKSVNVLKGDKALKKYPNEGKNGVIEIVLKDIERKDQTPNKDWSNISASQNLNQIKSLELVNGVKVEVKGITDTVVNIKRPLFVVDGVPVESIGGISPTEIESIHILKGADAKSYGVAANNGVALITTKKASKGSTASSNSKTANELDKVVVVSYKNDKANVVDVSPVFTTVEVLPVFNKVDNGWARYLERSLDRDLPKRRGAPAGQYTVMVSFIIDKNGKVQNVKSLNDPGYGSAEEALRVIEHCPNWIPAKQNGLAVNYTMRQAIVFMVAEN
jgi:TonB-dependent SusC/RagA subfamily outer membrane receptor